MIFWSGGALLRGASPNLPIHDSRGLWELNQGGWGWRLDIFGRGPDTLDIGCDPGFHLTGHGSPGMGDEGRRDGPCRAGPAGSGGGGFGGGFGQSLGRSLRGISGGSGFPDFFRIGTVFRSGASVPSGAWVEPRLPRRSPRTVCLGRTVFREGSRVDLRCRRFCSASWSGGFPGNDHRSMRSPLKGFVRPDGRRWRRHRSMSLLSLNTSVLRKSPEG